MTTEILNEFILNYLKNDKTNTSIMLNGNWGSGKSHYINNELVPYLEKNCKEVIIVSLYGLKSIDEISKSIFIEAKMKKIKDKNPKVLFAGKIIAKTVIKSVAGFTPINLDVSKKDLNDFFTTIDLSNKLLILEDIERSVIKISDVLGYVNGLVERDGVKVLLVANEEEILKNNVDDKKDENLQYLSIKEKTISDTILFKLDNESAIKNILNDYASYTIKELFQDDNSLYKTAFRIVNGVCNSNLRNLIYAIQKTKDIILKIDSSNEIYEDYYKCLFFGILYFSAKINKSVFPKWDGNNYFSLTLGDKNYPLMFVAYKYLRMQVFDNTAVEEEVEALRKYRFLEDTSEYNDKDLSTLFNYYVHTEEEVYDALEKIQKKLEKRDEIKLNAYNKLAYYLIYVSSIVDFNCLKACELMIKNLRGLEEEYNVEDNLIFYKLDGDIRDNKIKEQYDIFYKKLTDAFSFKNEKRISLLNPSELSSNYNKICANTEQYIKNHCFISLYNQDEIYEMLKKATSNQINDFRGILLAVYRDAGKEQFSEDDFEAFKRLLRLLENNKNSEMQWDKIQKCQIQYLKENIKSYLRSMAEEFDNIG